MEGMAEVGCWGVESVINANGRWPLSESGMPTTQHSIMRGWDEMACSIEPVIVSTFPRTFLDQMNERWGDNEREEHNIPVLNRCAATLMISSLLLIT